MSQPLPPLTGLPLGVVTVSLALATFMNVLDTTIATVSIPAIAGNLSVSPQQGTWVITSYAVCTAVALPLTGWLAKRFGEVRLFVTCAVLFSFVSWLCGLSPTFEILTLLRGLQGAVAGPMIPLSQTLLLRSYPREKHGLALALWGMTTVVAPILGRWITDNIGWSWIFYINLPVGLVCGVVTWRMLKGRESERHSFPVDRVGLGLMVTGVISLQMALDWGSEVDWFDSPLVVSLMAVAAICLTLFFIWEKDEPHPVIDLTLFRIRNFSVATIAISLGYMTFFGSMIIVPLWLQTQMGYTATWAGIAAAPIGVLTLILMPVVGANMSKFDPRVIASFGFVVFTATSYWHATFNTDVTIWQVAAPRLVMGIGMACFFVPLTALALSGVDPHRFASATGLTNFIRMLGGSFGASVAVTLWDHRTHMHHAQLVERVNPFEPATRMTLAALEGAGAPTSAALAILDREVGRQAAMLATNDLFLVATGIFMVMGGVVWLARGPFHAKRPVAAGE
ncbi:MAG: DHA2 family efflux MFS transporter permease subunit [Nitrospinae bacterium]|nr:DHA2 family efflux MFS transporter permease subunit [Nitrospinota bacterium]